MLKALVLAIALTAPGLDMAYDIAYQAELERVAPKFEAWREHHRYKVGEGGRGAGAKSRSATSLLVQAARFGLGAWIKPPVRVLCLREIQQSLEESSKALIEHQIGRLRYTGFDVTREYIRHSNGSTFLFRGLKDLRAAKQIKSYEDFDIFFVEEAANVSAESWAVLLPTLRKPLSELWAVFNREEEEDPVYSIFVKNPRPDSCILRLQPGPIDNPWFNESALPAEMAEDYKRDPDLAMHVWGGQPRTQGDKAVLSRVAIRGAMDRDIVAEGAIEVGVDVARFGDDSTQMYKRKGHKVIDHAEMRMADTGTVVQRVLEFGADAVRFKIDEGYNPGVVDGVRAKATGREVLGINFGGNAREPDRYGNAASEMWFNFPVNEADIPDDQELMRELSGRRFDYDSKGRKVIEPKDKYKSRNGGKSPDKADALLLAFYKGTARSAVEGIL